MVKNRERKTERERERRRELVSNLQSIGEYLPFKTKKTQKAILDAIIYYIKHLEAVLEEAKKNESRSSLALPLAPSANTDTVEKEVSTVEVEKDDVPCDSNEEQLPDDDRNSSTAEDNSNFEEVQSPMDFQ